MIGCYLKLVTKVIIIIIFSISKTILYLYFSYIKDFKNGTYLVSGILNILCTRVLYTLVYESLWIYIYEWSGPVVIWPAREAYSYSLCEEI